MTNAPLVDQAALARVGESVRERLAADPSVYQVPAEGAEIYAVGEFLSHAECDRIIALIDAVAKPSHLYDPDNPLKYRTSYSGDFDRSDSFVRMIERRLSDLLGFDESWAETFQGQRYAVGQEFLAHFDWFDTQAAYWPGEKTRGGQRSWTAMVYLNAVEEGGETEFTELGFSIPPQRGALLLWNNATPDGSPNRRVRHAGQPVLQGTKYIITKWFRTRRWS
jgi:prolyl 4-hydroxylase